MLAPSNGHVWHRAFFRWVRAQGQSPNSPDISQKCLRPRRHSPYLGRLRRRAMNPPKGVKAWGEAPLRPKEISRHRDTLGQIRAADNTAGRSATRHLKKIIFLLLTFGHVNSAGTQCKALANLHNIWMNLHIFQSPFFKKIKKN